MPRGTSHGPRGPQISRIVSFLLIIATSTLDTALGAPVYISPTTSGNTVPSGGCPEITCTSQAPCGVAPATTFLTPCEIQFVDTANIANPWVITAAGSDTLKIRGTVVATSTLTISASNENAKIAFDLFSFHTSALGSKFNASTVTFLDSQLTGTYAMSVKLSAQTLIFNRTVITQPDSTGGGYVQIVSYERNSGSTNSPFTLSMIDSTWVGVVPASPTFSVFSISNSVTDLSLDRFYMKRSSINTSWRILSSSTKETVIEDSDLVWNNYGSFARSFFNMPLDKFTMDNSRIFNASSGASGVRSLFAANQAGDAVVVPIVTLGRVEFNNTDLGALDAVESFVMTECSMNYSPNQVIVPLNLVSFPTSFDTKHTIAGNTFRQPNEDYPFMKIRVLQNFFAVAQMTMFSNDFVASNIARTTSTAACQILFDGHFKFSRVVNRPLVAPFWPPTLGDICSGQNMSFTSSALELRGKISSVSGSVVNVTANVEDLIFGGPVKLTMVHLYHNPILRNAVIYRPRNPTTDFIYLEGVSRTNIERADLEWSVLRIGSLPVIESLTYRFMQGSEFWTLVAPLQYNISVNTITNPSVGPSQVLVFHETPCNALCVPQNKLIEQCVSRASCYCTPPFSGPLCACDTRLLPAGVTCSEEEGKAWVLSGDMSLISGSSVTIPKETVLQVDGNMNLSGDVYLGESSGIVATGVILQNGVLKATCKLVERLTPRGCLVHPTINIHSNSFIFSDLTAIELTLDISDLSTDGSCQNPVSLSLDDLKASMFFSYNNTLMSSEASWTIKLDTGSDRDEKKFEKLFFRAEILSSSDRSASLGTTTKLATSSTSPKSCATIEQPVGALSLVVAPCKEKKIQWWWYGAPIIAVAVIVVIILVIVFNVKSVREAVIPYHKSEGQI